MTAEKAASKQADWDQGGARRRLSFDEAKSTSSGASGQYFITARNTI